MKLNNNHPSNHPSNHHEMLGIHFHVLIQEHQKCLYSMACPLIGLMSCYILVTTNIQTILLKIL